MPTCAMPNLSARYSTLPALSSLTTRRDVHRDGARASGSASGRECRGSCRAYRPCPSGRAWRRSRRSRGSRPGSSRPGRRCRRRRRRPPRPRGLVALARRRRRARSCPCRSAASTEPRTCWSAWRVSMPRRKWASTRLVELGASPSPWRDGSPRAASRAGPARSSRPRSRYVFPCFMLSCLPVVSGPARPSHDFSRPGVRDRTLPPLVDVVDAHRAGGAVDDLHRGLDVVGVEVGHLGLGDLRAPGRA